MTLLAGTAFRACLDLQEANLSIDSVMYQAWNQAWSIPRRHRICLKDIRETGERVLLISAAPLVTCLSRRSTAVRLTPKIFRFSNTSSRTRPWPQTWSSLKQNRKMICFRCFSKYPPSICRAFCLSGWSRFKVICIFDYDVTLKDPRTQYEVHKHPFNL